MTENLPTQCATCWYRTRFEGEWCCRKIELRRDYPEKDGVQHVITVQPGVCAAINPENRCDQFRPDVRERLTRLLGRR